MKITKSQLDGLLCFDVRFQNSKKLQCEVIKKQKMAIIFQNFFRKQKNQNFDMSRISCYDFWVLTMTKKTLPPVEHITKSPVLIVCLVVVVILLVPDNFTT